MVLSAIGVGVLITFAHFGAYGVFSSMERFQPGRAPFYLPAIFGTVAAFGLVPIMAIALSELYLRSDLDLLLASPITLGALFASKLAGLVTAATGLIGLLMLSTLTGYGRAVDAGIVFYLGALVLILGLMILVSAVDMSIVMLAARLMPAKRVQALVFVLSGVVGAVLWLTIQLVSRSGEPPANEVPFSDRRIPFSGPLPPQLRGLITSYPARALHALQYSNATTFLIQTAVFVAITGALVAICSTIFKVTFYEGSARVRSSASPGAVPIRGQRLREQVAGRLPYPIGGLVTKEWLNFPRDLRYLSNLIFPFVMVFFFAFRGFSGTNTPNLWASVAPVGLLSLLITSGIVMPSVGMEGRNFGLLRSLPISIDQVLIAKFAAFYPLILLATWVALVPLAVYRGAGPLTLAGLLGGAIWLTIGVTVLGIGLGALGANFEAESPQKAVSPGIGFIGFFIGMLFLAANGGLILWLIRGPGGASSFWLIALGLAGAALATSGLIVVVVLAGRRHLQRLDF